MEILCSMHGCLGGAVDRCDKCDTPYCPGHVDPPIHSCAREDYERMQLRIAALERENERLLNACAEAGDAASAEYLKALRMERENAELRDAFRRSVARAFSKNGKKTQRDHVMHEFWVELVAIAQSHDLKERPCGCEEAPDA